MRHRVMALVFMMLVCLTYAAATWAQAPSEDAVNQTLSINFYDDDQVSAESSQTTVVCRGWHALCDFATDCEVVGSQANCACWKVQEPYIIETKKIQDPTVKYWTQAVCTTSQPCDVDEAPVCKMIKLGQFKVKGVKYPWVSTFSYRGWCENWNPVSCDAAPWADCMSAPCTVIENPTDPERPLSCQCRMKDSAFIGPQGSCEPGKVMSTIPKASWNFKKATFSAPMPGYDYVKGACAALQSDNTAEE
jgi:hypothetical protein